MMIQKALNVTNAQFDLTMCEADTDKACKHNGVTLKTCFSMQNNIYTLKNKVIKFTHHQVMIT